MNKKVKPQLKWNINKVKESKGGQALLIRWQDKKGRIGQRYYDTAYEALTHLKHLERLGIKGLVYQEVKLLEEKNA